MHDAIAQTLQLDKEIFFAVLDVVLDIDTELWIGSNPIYISIKRTYVRYEILCPENSISAADRYCELRWKACSFLQHYGFISSLEYHEQGGHRWYSVMEVRIPHHGRPQLGRLLTQLRLEEARRNPGQQMGTDIGSATARVLILADSFHRVALKLRDRRTGREPVHIQDEYDVQYVFSALLETQFDDVRPEEWAPSYAGRSSRVDFLLKREGVVVETKMTRDGLNTGKVGDELIIDIAHYKQVPDCKALVCFVYDPGHRLTNPSGLENDLSRITDGLDVRALIRPRS